MPFSSLKPEVSARKHRLTAATFNGSSSLLNLLLAKNDAIAISEVPERQSPEFNLYT